MPQVQLADRDPEEARKLLAPVLENMMEAVHRYEGTVNQVMGDLFRVIKERELDQQLHILSMPIPPEHPAEMVRMIDQGKISGKIAKALFEKLLDSGESL